MADLGSITHIYDPTALVRPDLIPVSDYKVERGNELGAVVIFDPQTHFRPALHGPLTGYLVRQTGIRFRQLWPAHGQRFPQ